MFKNFYNESLKERTLFLESPASEFTIEQVLNNHTCPCDVIVAPHRHFRLQLKGKEVVTNDYVLRLQGTVDEFYLLGNPVTESIYFATYESAKSRTFRREKYFFTYIL